jgi:hypothetical protein
MTDLPYHHDWTPRFETSFGLRVKWFGRWSETPEWKIEPSRLASDLICFFYVESGSCELVINGVPVPLEFGELAVLRGGDVFSASHDPAKPHTSLSACLSLSRGLALGWYAFGFSRSGVASRSPQPERRASPDWFVFRRGAATPQ